MAHCLAIGFVDCRRQKFVGTTDMGTGNVNNQEMPVGTTIALLERGSRIISAVHKRLYNGMKQEFKLIADLMCKKVVHTHIQKKVIRHKTLTNVLILYQ